MQGQPSTAAIKPVWWHARWLPVLYDACGNYRCLDMAPATGGHRGQVIFYYHDDARRVLEAASFKLWLDGVAHDLEAGAFVLDEYQVLQRRDE